MNPKTSPIQRAKRNTETALLAVDRARRCLEALDDDPEGLKRSLNSARISLTHVREELRHMNRALAAAGNTHREDEPRMDADTR